MEVHIVVAYDLSLAIGKEGGLPWGRSLPRDLRHFQEITRGHHLIMGRLTYNSIGKPLDGRTSIVLTTDHGFSVPSTHGVTVRSFRDAIAYAKLNDQKCVIAIGGERVFQYALPLASKIYLTRVRFAFSGCDRYFPEDPAKSNEWMPEEVERHPADDRNAYRFAFETYVRS